jgi:membrane protease YdiL (CAAX protease family)
MQATADTNRWPSGRAGAALLVDLLATARHLARALRRSRLLLVYLALGLVSGLATGPAGLATATVNYLLLGLYVLIIFRWTRGHPTMATDPAMEAQGPPRRRDLALAGLLLVLTSAYSLWFWAGGLPVVALDGMREALLAAGWERRVAAAAANAAVNTLGMLAPALLLTRLLGRRLGQVGARPRGLGLAAALVAVGIAVAGLIRLATGHYSTPLFAGLTGLPLALGLYAVQILINALPEEFIFRGVLLSRLLPWLRHPHHALVLTSVLFVAAHLPSVLARPHDLPAWLIALGALVSPGPQPTGLVWGYLAYRTRSIWPGILWHASFITLGVLFL